MNCLMTVGDITLSVTYNPWLVEAGAETAVPSTEGVADHRVQVSDSMGEIAQAKCTEIEAMFLIAGFCVTDQAEITVQGLQTLWYQTFPQEAFNP